MPRNLAIARAGENSRHFTWLSDRSRKNFDVMASYYGVHEGKWKADADLYVHEHGLKYPWFSDFIAKNGRLADYDAVWLSDDDIKADTATISDMFDIFHERKLLLAQPSIARDTVFSFVHLVCQPGKLLRHVGYVEEQVPIFSREALAKLAPTFSLNKSGWGLGLSWAALLGHPTDRMAVIDATPVRHIRRLRAGEMYTQVLPAMGIDHNTELEAMRSKYGNFDTRQFSAVDLDPGDSKTPERRRRQGP